MLKTLHVVLLKENNHQCSGVMERSYVYHPDSDCFPIIACPQVFYSSYAAAAYQQLHFFLAKKKHRDSIDYGETAKKKKV